MTTSERRAIRRGFDEEQRRAICRARRTTSGAANAVARTLAERTASNEAGADQRLGHGTKSPTKSRTAAAVPLRVRWVVNRTGTPNRAGGEENAPGAVMN